MKLPAPIRIVAAALALLAFSLVGWAVSISVAGTPEPSGGVALPAGDPLMAAIEQRFGRPDRITGSGRTFLHYDLSNGDAVTLIVSGGRVIGLQHDQKPK